MPLCDAHGTGAGRLELAGVHCALHPTGAKMLGPRFARLRIWLGLTCALSARGLEELYFAVLPWGARCAPRAVCRAVRCAVLCCVCAMRGRLPALIQSGDAIGFTSVLEIWDSAGRGSVMHLSRKPAQPVWPWESVPVASTATNRGYSSSAYCCEPPSCQGGTHPPAGPRTADSLPQKLRGLSGGTCDRQISPQCLGKDMGKPQPLHVIEKRGGTQGPQSRTHLQPQLHPPNLLTAARLMGPAGKEDRAHESPSLCMGGTVNSPGPGQMGLVPGVLVHGHSHVSAEV